MLAGSVLASTWNGEPSRLLTIIATSEVVFSLVIAASWATSNSSANPAMAVSGEIPRGAEGERGSNT